MSKITGIDISKETFDASILDEHGKVLKQLKLSNDLKGFKLLEKHITQENHCVMEASGPYYLKLAYYLFEKGFKVSVVNPLVIRRYCQMKLNRTKTDKKDAELIARFGITEKPSLWKPDEPVIEELRQLNSVLEGFVRSINSAKNRLEALECNKVINSLSLKSTKDEIKFYETQIKKLEDAMEQLIKKNYRQNYEALRSIPGIGKKTSIVLIVITNNFQNFNHYKQLISYVGLSPRIYESGTSVKGRARICKMGMSHIRKLLYMCSWAAKRHNSFCIEFYNRLKAKGKPERVIKIAIANKLLKQAFAIIKSQTTFDKNYQIELGF